MSTFTDAEKERIFVERTKDLYPAVWQFYQDLLAHQKMGRDELDEYNFERRKEIVAYAYEHSPFYRQLYSSNGIHPNDIKSEADWARLPLVTKEMVREHWREMMTVPITSPYAQVRNTGGSTGKPLTVYSDRRWISPAYEWRAWGWWSMRVPTSPILGLNEARVWRMQGVGAETVADRQRLDRAFWPMQRAYLDAFKMSDENVRAFMDDVNRIKPQRIMGYTGGLLELSQRILSGEFKLSANPLSVAVTSSVLSKSARSTIQRAFGCDVYDMYSSNETSYIAIEYGGGSGRLCVFSDTHNMELIDDKGDVVGEGETGRTTATIFGNRVMPLIRYVQGDRTRMYRRVGDCELPFPIIDPIEGRASDFLIDSSGRKHFGFNASFDTIPTAVHGFQYRQHSKGKVSLLIVKNKMCVDAEEQIKRVEQEWLVPLSDVIDFDIQFVEQIPHDAGKLRFIVYEQKGLDDTI